MLPTNHVLFDRSDPEKQFLMQVIQGCPAPEAAMANFRTCIARRRIRHG